MGCDCMKKGNKMTAPAPKRPIKAADTKKSGKRYGK
jgi:hypothetical protein